MRGERQAPRGTGSSRRVLGNWESYELCVPRRHLRCTTRTQLLQPPPQAVLPLRGVSLPPYRSPAGMHHLRPWREAGALLSCSSSDGFLTCRTRQGSRWGAGAVRQTEVPRAQGNGHATAKGPDGLGVGAHSEVRARRGATLMSDSMSWRRACTRASRDLRVL